jgi:hypothetical protein
MAILFTASNLLVLPLWLLMIVVPHWRLTRRLLHSPLVVVPLPVLYALLVVPRLGELLPLLVYPRLDDVAAVLGRPDGAVLAWIHFLAFDLFVGRWAYLDSRERGVSAWLMAGVLVVTLLLGPLGLLLYLGLRAVHAGRAPRPRVDAT